jgi:hypothetical protein
LASNVSLELYDADGNLVLDADSAPVVASVASPLTMTGLAGNATQAEATMNNGNAVFNSGSFGIAGLAGTRQITYQVTHDSRTFLVDQTVNLTAGLPSRIAISTQPGTVIARTAFTNPPVANIQDAYGNRVLVSTDSIKADLAFNVSTLANISLVSGATSKTVQVGSGTGISTFSGDGELSYDSAGTFRIRFSYVPASQSDTTVVTPALSNSFIVAAADPAQVAFSTNPSNVASRGAFATTPVLTVQDANGNAVIGTTTTSVTLEAVPASGTTPIFISGNTASSLGGLITFPDLRVGAKAGSYTLRVASISNNGNHTMTGGQSSLAFNIILPSWS